MNTKADTTVHVRMCGWIAGAALIASAWAEPEEPPATVELTGIVRDFRRADEPGGHPDFENAAPLDGRYSNNIMHVIGNDGKPAFTGVGARVGEQWRDVEHRQIAPCLYANFALSGDIEGTWEEPGTGGITSAKTLGEWFRDVPVYNMSDVLSLTLVRQPDGKYVFDDLTDPFYEPLNGFFPIDDRLFADSGGNGAHAHNYYFTFEIHTQFQYDAAADQNFKFEGTDTVWLFIDGHLVNDLIGVHAAHDQYVEVDRLGLQDGEWYPLDFFFAQRYMPQSHFRIETNILLESLPISTISAVFD